MLNVLKQQPRLNIFNTEIKSIDVTERAPWSRISWISCQASHAISTVIRGFERIGMSILSLNSVSNQE